jgi:small subunit ribosomal protein S2
MTILVKNYCHFEAYLILSSYMNLLKTDSKKAVESMFQVGAHFGYAKARRHPSTKPFIFGAKDGVEIIDLEKTAEMLEKAKEFAYETAKNGGQVLFVGTKKEVASYIKDMALSVDQPYVTNRWIGGTLTNFAEIQRRVKRLEELEGEKEKGLLAKYTKKERLLIDRELEKLNERFGGITNMKAKPAAMFIVDSKNEENALAEAILENIPVISVSNSDCDITSISHPILANDSSVKSVRFFVDEIVAAVKEGQKDRK